jgi:hypothetical protein
MNEEKKEQAGRKMLQALLKPGVVLECKITHSDGRNTVILPMIRRGEQRIWIAYLVGWALRLPCAAGPDCERPGVSVCATADEAPRLLGEMVGAVIGREVKLIFRQEKG